MYELRRSSFGSSLIEFVLVLVLISAFVTVVAVFFVVRTFVRYPEHRKPLWCALAVSLVSLAGSGLLYKLTTSDVAPALAGTGIGIAIAILLIACLVIELKYRDTLLRENVNLIDEVLHKPWW